MDYENEAELDAKYNKDKGISIGLIWGLVIGLIVGAAFTWMMMSK